MSTKDFLMARDKDIRELYAQGKTLNQVGELYGLTRQRIATIVKDLPKHFGRGRRRKTVTQASERNERKQQRQRRKEEIAAAYLAGDTQANVGRQFGIPQTSVSLIVAQINKGRK
jgi:DNA-binding transcriptional regulator LsrR (DeoR family)